MTIFFSPRLLFFYFTEVSSVIMKLTTQWCSAILTRTCSKNAIFFFNGLGDIRIPSLTLSRRRPLSYRNQSIDLIRKSMDLFLYDNGLRLERVKVVNNNHYDRKIVKISCFGLNNLENHRGSLQFSSFFIISIVIRTILQLLVIPLTIFKIILSFKTFLRLVTLPN